MIYTPLFLLFIFSALTYAVLRPNFKLTPDATPSRNYIASITALRFIFLIAIMSFFAIILDGSARLNFIKVNEIYFSKLLETERCEVHASPAQKTLCEEINKDLITITDYQRYSEIFKHNSLNFLTLTNQQIDDISNLHGALTAYMLDPKFESYTGEQVFYLDTMARDIASASNYLHAVLKDMRGVPHIVAAALIYFLLFSLIFIYLAMFPHLLKSRFNDIKFDDKDASSTAIKVWLEMPASLLLAATYITLIALF